MVASEGTLGNGGTAAGACTNANPKQRNRLLFVQANGTLDPAYNPATGVLTGTKNANSFVADAGHVYATALALSGIDPTGRGRNARKPLGFIQKP